MEFSGARERGTGLPANAGGVGWSSVELGRGGQACPPTQEVWGGVQWS